MKCARSLVGARKPVAAPYFGPIYFFLDEDQTMKSSIGLPVLLLMALVLAGCVTSEQYQASLNDIWTGANEAALVEQFGPPAEVTAEGSGRILNWKSSSEVTNSTSGPVGGGITIGFSSTTMHHCRLSAHLDGEGRAARLEWKATQGDVADEQDLSFGLPGVCPSVFPAKIREPKAHRKLEPWIGKAKDELVAAYGAPPDTYELADGETRWLTWSDVGTRTVAAPQDPDPDMRSTRSVASLCSVSFAVVDGLVDRYMVRGAGRCPMPESE